MTAQWKKFYGSQDQLEEMSNAKHGWIVRLHDGQETEIEKGEFNSNFKMVLARGLIKEYLICEPILNADMIARYAKTGQPVYCRSDSTSEWLPVEGAPSWCGFLEYSFNPPKEKQYIEVRDYLYESDDGTIRKATVHKDDRNLASMSIVCNTFNGFIRWLDDDWRKVGV